MVHFEVSALIISLNITEMCKSQCNLCKKAAAGHLTTFIESNIENTQTLFADSCILCQC